MSKHWTDVLVERDACPSAIDWARGYPDLSAAWAACERGDWMLWLAGKYVPDDAALPERRSPERVALVRAALACAQTVWPYVREEDRATVQACYDATEAWVAGTGTLVTIRAAYAAAYAATAATAAYAADAAAYAAAAAASAATAASAAYAAAAARTSVRRHCADLVRQYVACPVLEGRDD